MIDRILSDVRYLEKINRLNEIDSYAVFYGFTQISTNGIIKMKAE